jgi:type VI protein secretion system component Hcp
MEQPYITVTLEVSGYEEALLSRMHDHLRQCLRDWYPSLSYGEVRIAYQDQEQRDQDAQLEPAPDTWDEDAD